jgi:hypothetical protein
MPAAIIIGTEKAPSAQELDIPADAVAIEGTPPEKGDEIEFTIKGRVVRSEGQNISVEPLECNGQKIDVAAEASESEPDEDPEASMMKAAKKADDSDLGY